MMERGERVLYHQIHPVKLLTDVTTRSAFVRYVTLGNIPPMGQA